MPICFERKMSANDITFTEQHDNNNSATFEQNFQNVHPMLPWYKYDLETKHMRYEKLHNLLSLDSELQLLDFITGVNLIAKDRPCLTC